MNAGSHWTQNINIDEMKYFCEFYRNLRLYSIQLEVCI